MMEAGDPSKRQELLEKVNASKISGQFDQMNLNSGSNYNDEEAKVAKYGDIGQGERLTGAKAAAQRRKK